jgi:hypothetical protein
VDLKIASLAEGNDPRIQTVHERPERKEIQFTLIVANAELSHGYSGGVENRD